MPSWPAIVLALGLVACGGRERARSSATQGQNDATIRVNARRETVLPSPSDTLVYCSNGHLLRMDLPAAGGRPLVADGHNLRPVWSPDGDTIALLRRSPDASYRLFLVDHRGGNLREVPDGPSVGSNDLDDIVYGFSGSTLVWLLKGERRDPELRAHDLSTHRTRTIVTAPLAQSFALARGGAAFLFVAGELQTVDLSTGKTASAYRGKFFLPDPPQSTSGGTLLFAAQEDESLGSADRLLYSLDTRAGALRVLNQATLLRGRMEIVLSPDERFLAEVVSWSQAVDWRASAFYVRNLLTDEAKRIGLPCGEDTCAAMQPSWAPDSRRLVFTLKELLRNGVAAHRLMTVDASVATPTAAPLTDGHSAAWRPR
jgi:hypothetical protein